MSERTLPQEVIRHKRDGARLTRAEIAGFIEGLTDGTITEGQVAAFAMAVFFRGMAEEETVALTLAMRDSGTVLDWSDLDGPGRRQAFDRRRRRQCLADAGADARRLRLLRADDLGPRPWPYRRHARQARLDPGLCLAARYRDIPRGREGCRLRDHRPDRRIWRRPIAVSMPSAM